MAERGRYRVTVTSPVRACVLPEQGKSLPGRSSLLPSSQGAVGRRRQPPRLCRNPMDLEQP